MQRQILHGIKGIDVIFNFFTGNLTGIAAAVIGGWYECLWTGPDSYGGNFLITSILGIQTSRWAQLLGLNDLYAKAVWTTDYNVLGIEGLRVTGIMPKVNDLKDKGSHIFTIMYGSDPNGHRAYGLSQIASDKKDNPSQKDAYTSKDKNEFKKVLDSIANTIEGPSVPDEPMTSNAGKIKLKKISQIKSITIGETILSPDTVNQIKEAIKNSESYNSTEDSGDLNLNDYPDLKKSEDITISY